MMLAKSYDRNWDQNRLITRVMELIAQNSSTLQFKSTNAESSRSRSSNNKPTSVYSPNDATGE